MEKIKKVLIYIINPVITIFCVLGIIIMIIGNVGVIMDEADRKDDDIMFYLNHGDYPGAYETYYLQRDLNTVSGEEYGKYKEYYDFYDNFVMSRIKSHAGKTDEAKQYSGAMRDTLNTGEYFEMKPIYEYLLSLDEDSFR